MSRSHSSEWGNWDLKQSLWTLGSCLHECCAWEPQDPGRRAPQDHLVVLGEHIESQGLLTLVDELDGLLQAAHTDKGHYGPKDLLLHHLGLRVHIREDGGG